MTRALLQIYCLVQQWISSGTFLYGRRCIYDNMDVCDCRWTWGSSVGISSAASMSVTLRRNNVHDTTCHCQLVSVTVSGVDLIAVCPCYLLTRTVTPWHNVMCVETSDFTQLKICYLMTTFRCPLDILITSWLFTTRWSTWPGNHLVPRVAKLVGSCIPIHAHRCLPDPKCLFYPSGLSLCLSVDHFCLVPVNDTCSIEL